MLRSITLKTEVTRHHPEVSRLAVVPDRDILGWGLDGTTIVEAIIDGVHVGRRRVKRWDAHRWRIDLPIPMCRRLGVDIGSEITLTIRIPTDDLPDEVQRLLETDPTARKRWESLNVGQRRTVSERVFAAKRPQTRDRRARELLCDRKG